MSGELYVVATPIGNLGDMVPRAVEVLQAVDVIAAEDTRHSGRLMSHLGIKTPLIAYHDHSDDRKVDKLVEILKQGKSVALISDAGTPLISDPGYKLVRMVRSRDIKWFLSLAPVLLWLRFVHRGYRVIASLLKGLLLQSLLPE